MSYIICTMVKNIKYYVRFLDEYHLTSKLEGLRDNATVFTSESDAQKSIEKLLFASPKGKQKQYNVEKY